MFLPVLTTEHRQAPGGWAWAGPAGRAELLNGSILCLP